VESRNFQSTQSSHAASRWSRHTLSVLSLLRTFCQVLTYLYCRIIVCCVQRHTFPVTCNVKQLLWKHLRIYLIIAILFTCNDTLLLNTVRDRRVISDWRRPETARTTRVGYVKCIEYKLVVLLESFSIRRQMKESWQVTPTAAWRFACYSVINY